jgi:hypothetical protein
MPTLDIIELTIETQKLEVSLDYSNNYFTNTVWIL